MAREEICTPQRGTAPGLLSHTAFLYREAWPLRYRRTQLFTGAQFSLHPKISVIYYAGMKQILRLSGTSILFLCAAFVAASLGLAGAQRTAINSLDFRDGFETGDMSAWQFPYQEDWEILGGAHEHYLHMKRMRNPGVPRRPLQYALLKNKPVGSFEFQAEVRRERRSMIVVFNYVDTLHFYYTHLSVDSGGVQPVHNGIFIVNGGDRKRIAGISAAPALPDNNWHHVRIARDARIGSIEIFMDRSSQPLFSVTDQTFKCGLIGIGSFDETGDFKNIELHSSDAMCQP